MIVQVAELISQRGLYAEVRENEYSGSTVAVCSTFHRRRLAWAKEGKLPYVQPRGIAVFRCAHPRAR